MLLESEEEHIGAEEEGEEGMEMEMGKEGRRRTGESWVVESGSVHMLISQTQTPQI